VALTSWGNAKFDGIAPASFAVVGAIVCRDWHFKYWWRHGATEPWTIQDDDKKPTVSLVDPDWSSVKSVSLARADRPDKVAEDASLGGGSSANSRSVSPDGRLKRVKSKTLADSHSVGAINIRGFSDRKSGVLLELNEGHGANIVAVSEWGRPSSVELQQLKQAGWTVEESVRFAREVEHPASLAPAQLQRGGSALLFRSQMYDVTRVPLQLRHNNCQIVCAVASVKARQAAPLQGFVAVYPTPCTGESDAPLVVMLEEVVQELSSKGIELAAMMGDFNARHGSWDAGPNTNDAGNWRRGAELAQFFQRLGLTVSSKPSYPRLGSNVVTAIDLIVTTTPICSLLLDNQF
jgi:hypothetical protein